MNSITILPDPTARTPLLRTPESFTQVQPCQVCDTVTPRKCRSCDEPTCKSHLYALAEDEQPELCGACLDVLRSEPFGDAMVSREREAGLR